ncbi:peroxiredoxin, type II [Haematococcus lacustris]
MLSTLAPMQRAGAQMLRSSFPAASTVRIASARTFVTAHAIAVGDKLPQASFKYFDSEGNMKEASVDSLCKGKKVVFFAVPGAFTPTCSLKHLPGFVESAEEIKGRGVDTIACISVNDAFVMDAWGKSVGASDKVLMLADGNAAFTKACGVELDLVDKGLGMRSRRYAMLVEDGTVKALNLEEGGAFTISSAESILETLALAK